MSDTEIRTRGTDAEEAGSDGRRNDEGRRDEGRGDERPTDRERPTLSVVVITRNEEAQVGRCLSAVLDATADFEREIILVDSNSEDRTVERATDFPVSVLRIPTDDLSTPSAGRYVGGAFATGEQVLFVDGDVVLEDDWLDVASRLLVGEDDVAGVGGYLGETDATQVAESEWLAGVALYDAAALAEVGGFDPYLRALEDLHLSFELRESGYRLVRLPTVVGEQVRESAGYLEPFRRWQRGYHHGVYDALFRSATSPGVLYKHAHSLRYSLAGTAWLALGVATVVAPPVFALWLAASLAGVAWLVRTQGRDRAYSLVAMWTLTSVALLDHEWCRPPDPGQYPLDRIERVQVEGRLTDGRGGEGTGNGPEARERDAGESGRRAGEASRVASHAGRAGDGAGDGPGERERSAADERATGDRTTDDRATESEAE